MSLVKLTIGEIANLLGISTKSIRHFHEVGVLPEVERSENGYRLYTLADLHRIQRIRDLQGFGLSLRQVKFILEADEPDAHLHRFLQQRSAALADEIYRLQQQQAHLQAFLRGDIPPAPSTASHQIVHDVIRPVSNNLADVLIEVERHVLDELDRLPHHPAYSQYWEQVAALFIRSIQAHEHQYILWLERYLALANMEYDDLQAQAWLQELTASSFAWILSRAFDLPQADALPHHEQLQIRRLIPSLLFEGSTPLQKLFLSALPVKKE
jgi:DNA-binding transcriptional MerR regulator